eukprot:TRINITY_DN1142_c0_g1_i4.p2 TRINITY_DN1142_c0_g1~~TRINITY_DN1142_c0_g1_i4.p2  ORF type:complete len:164 (-),score=41.68 TRINITY_DN1142_c0_g1_i4:157-648(-)
MVRNARCRTVRLDVSASVADEGAAPIHHPYYSHPSNLSRSPSPPVSPPLAQLNPHASAFFPNPADYSRHLPSVPVGRSRMTPTPPHPQPVASPLLVGHSMSGSQSQLPQAAPSQYAHGSQAPFRVASSVLPPSSGARLVSFRGFFWGRGTPGTVFLLSQLIAF